VYLNWESHYWDSLQWQACKVYYNSTKIITIKSEYVKYTKNNYSLYLPVGKGVIEVIVVAIWIVSLVVIVIVALAPEVGKYTVNVL